MTHLKTTIIFLLSLFLIASCSSKYDVTVTEVFRSNILDNEAKMFTFSIVFVNHTAQEERGNNGDERQKKPRNGDKRGQRNEANGKSAKQESHKQNGLEEQMVEELEERLLEKFEENNYCRKGYFELGRTLNKSIYTINGECNESATASDKKAFKNTPTKT